MSPNREFIYAGNRSTVLKRMLELGLHVTHLLPTEGSWLAREVGDYDLPATTIVSKAQAIEFLEQARFDVFVSTGFRFILPISKLRALHPQAVFVNVHPSWLPDLRGADPIPGAVLFRRDSGVTCHLMDDGIDTGQIIAQRSIRYFDGLDAKLLYHLCLQLEPDVFQCALEREFAVSQGAGPSVPNPIYYSFKTGDDCFHADDRPRKLVDRVRAFNTPSKGLRFSVDGQTYKTFAADLIPGANNSPVGRTPGEWEISAVYEDCLLLNAKEAVVRLASVSPRPLLSIVGKKITAPNSD